MLYRFNNRAWDLYRGQPVFSIGYFRTLRSSLLSERWRETVAQASENKEISNRIARAHRSFGDIVPDKSAKAVNSVAADVHRMLT